MSTRAITHRCGCRLVRAPDGARLELCGEHGRSVRRPRGISRLARTLAAGTLPSPDATRTELEQAVRDAEAIAAQDPRPAFVAYLAGRQVALDAHDRRARRDAGGRAP